MARLDEVEEFAKSRGADISFCRGIVFRLKYLGVSDEVVLSSAILSQTKANFDEIYLRFGRKVAVLATSLQKDTSLPKNIQEESYIKQLKDAPWDSILIKLCEISATLKLIKEKELSKNRKTKLIKKLAHQLNILKNKITPNKTPNLEKLLDGINENLEQFGQRPVRI